MSFLVMRYGIASGSENMDLRYDYDTNIYYIIGHGWLHGVPPYSGLADLKGPLVFLEHGLGSLLTPGSHCGTMALHSVALGFWLLYCLKTAALYVRRSTAWAITGLFFAYSMHMAAEAAELPMCLQQVTLYHLLVWSRGRKDVFCDRHLAIAGLGMAVAALTKFNLAVFWVPMLALMLWANRARPAKSIAMVAAGLLLPLLAFGLYFSHQGALGDMWREYVQTALLYGAVPFADSALATRHIGLCSLALPYLPAHILPVQLALIPGAMLLALWVLPAMRGRGRRGCAATAALGASFLLGAYAAFSGAKCFLHYAYYFYPYVFLSLIGAALPLRKAVKCEGARSLLHAMGLLFPLLTLGAAVAIPVCAKLCKPEKGVAELRENVRLLSDKLASEHANFIVSDARHLSVIYRKTGAIPPIRHFVPQLIPNGEAAFRNEIIKCLAARKPDYVISSTADTRNAEFCIRQSGVGYEKIDTRQLGFPPFPATSPYPEPVIYRRLD